MPLPRISLVTPSFNQAAFLGQALASVISQGYPDLDYQVLDGGSADGSAEIIRAHAAALSFWRSSRDGGQSAALREGLARANGEVFGWLNSDDYLEPGALRAVGEEFGRKPEVNVVYGDLRYVDRDGRRLFTAHLVLDLRILAWESHYVAQPAMFFRKAAVERVGGIDAGKRFAMDFDLVVRLLLGGARAFKMRRVLANFRLHQTSKTSTQQEICDAEVADTLRAHGLARGGVAERRVRRLLARGLRFASDPRCMLSAIESRLRGVPPPPLP